MAYARLDVFWPDGLFKTYPLEAPTVSIGRSAGNTIPLDTSTISRYHVSITYQDGEVRIVDLDSANGTFVDGVRLKSNESHVLYGGEEVMIGELRLIYHFLDDTPTRPVVVPEDTTRRVELSASDFRIDVEEPEAAIPPGAHISAQVTITNTGETPERFITQITGVPSTWVRVDRPDIEIAAGQSAEIVISFKPLRRSDSKPGSYPVQIVVRAKSAPDKMLSGVVMLGVLPYSGFGMALAARTMRQGERFRLHLHNQGSAPLPLALSARDLGGGLTIALPQSQVTLGPGERTVIQGQARPKRTAYVGEPRQHAFDLIARSGDASGFLVATRGYLLERPPLPRWSVFAIGGIGITLLALILFAALILLRPTAQPQIAAFNVSSTRITAGDPLTLSWTVQDAATVDILLNQTPVAQSIDPAQGRYELATTGYTGEIVVGLVARGGGRFDDASQIVVIAPAAQVRAFTVTPERLVRNVVSRLSLTWDIPGATSVRISGLEGFETTTPLPLALNPSGTLAVDGIAIAPLSLVLTASTDSGTVIEERRTVGVTEAECTANVDVSLLASPGESASAQVVGSVPDGTRVPVDARDATTGWLRFPLVGGISGWGRRSDFTCDSAFRVEDLRVALNVPTAVPPTTSPAPSPSIPLTPAATLSPGLSGAAQGAPAGTPAPSPFPTVPPPTGIPTLTATITFR